jgi:hypothetical protein
MPRRASGTAWTVAQVDDFSVAAPTTAPGELLLYAHVGPDGAGYGEYVLDPDCLDDSNVQEADRL